MISIIIGGRYNTSLDGCVPQFPWKDLMHNDNTITYTMDDKSSPPSSIEITTQQLSQLSQSQLAVENSTPPPPEKSNKYRSRNSLQQVMDKVRQNLCELEKQAPDKDMDDTTTNTSNPPSCRGSTIQIKPRPLKNRMYADSQSQLDNDEDVSASQSQHNLLKIPIFGKSAGSVKSGSKSGDIMDETEACASFNSASYRAQFEKRRGIDELDESDTSRTTLGNESQYQNNDIGTKPSPVDRQLEKSLGIDSNGGGKKSGLSTNTTNSPSSKQNTEDEPSATLEQKQSSQNPTEDMPRDKEQQKEPVEQQQSKQQEPPSEQQPPQEELMPEHQPPEQQEPSPKPQELPQPSNNNTSHTTAAQSVCYDGVPPIMEILYRACISTQSLIRFYTLDGESGFEIKSDGDKVTNEDKDAFFKWLANEVNTLCGRTFSPASVPALLNGVGLKASVPTGWKGLRPFYTREDMLFVQDKPELMKQIIDTYKKEQYPLVRKRTVQDPSEESMNKRRRSSQGNATGGESVESGAAVAKVAEKEVPPNSAVESSGAKSPAPVATSTAWRLVVGLDKNNPGALKLAYKHNDGSAMVDLPSGVPTLYFDLRAPDKSWTVILANLPGAFLDETSVLSGPSLYHLRAAIQKLWATIPSYKFCKQGGSLISSDIEKSVTVHKYQQALINEDAQAHNQADGEFENPFVVYITYD